MLNGPHGLKASFCETVTLSSLRVFYALSVIGYCFGTPMRGNVFHSNFLIFAGVRKMNKLLIAKSASIESPQNIPSEIGAEFELTSIDERAGSMATASIPSLLSS
jgi:hypothetical protein